MDVGGTVNSIAAIQAADLGSIPANVACLWTKASAKYLTSTFR